MKASKILMEATSDVVYKIIIKYKKDTIEVFLTRQELLNSLLKNNDSKNIILNLSNFIKHRFKLKEINSKTLFYDLNGLQIINEKTQTSFQIIKVDPLDTKDGFQIIVNFKKGLEDLKTQDITDEKNTDKTDNKILDIRLQEAIVTFKKIVEKE